MYKFRIQTNVTVNKILFLFLLHVYYNLFAFIWVNLFLYFKKYKKCENINLSFSH